MSMAAEGGRAPDGPCTRAVQELHDGGPEPVMVVAWALCGGLPKTRTHSHSSIQKVPQVHHNSQCKLQSAMH